MPITIRISITDDLGEEVSLSDLAKALRAIERLNEDEAKVEKQEQKELWKCYAVEAFPIKGGKTWQLDGETFARWKDAYPGLAIAAELNPARQWLMDNPSKLKTAAGMKRFLGGWLKHSYAAKLERMGLNQPSLIAEPRKPKAITASNARYDLIKRHGVSDARDWSDEEVLSHYERLETSDATR